MWCDDYPGAVVLTAPSNKRLKLAARVDLGNESFFSAPQLKRDPLGGAFGHWQGRIHAPNLYSVCDSGCGMRNPEHGSAEGSASH
jgi:hypothetical protein